MAQKAADKKPEMIEVVLKKPHSHQGVDKAAGETITVTKDQAAWLKNHGVV